MSVCVCVCVSLCVCLCVNVQQSKGVCKYQCGVNIWFLNAFFKRKKSFAKTRFDLCWFSFSEIYLYKNCAQNLGCFSFVEICYFSFAKRSNFDIVTKQKLVYLTLSWHFTILIAVKDKLNMDHDES